MKIKFEKKHIEIGIISFLVVASSILFYYFLFHHTSLFGALNKIFKIVSPIIYGFILAFLMTPILNFLENRVVKVLLKKWHIDVVKQRKMIRAISLILTVILVIAMIYGFFAMLIPRLKDSIVSIVLQFDTYITNFEKWINGFLTDNPDWKIAFNDFLDKYSGEFRTFLNENVLNKIDVVVKSVSLSLISIIKVLWNLIIGFIISIYVLGSKETFSGQSKKVVYALFNKKIANNVVESGRFINKTFMGFISGKIVDSIIIGFLCFIGTSIIGTPYALLVSVIVGVTNIIPFFGPFLGAIPSVLLILIIEPIQALYFVLFILFLQQLDGNVIGPKILGGSTGLSGFWVIFAITLFGGLFGVGGMIIGVPFCAIVYAVVRVLVNKRLEKKDMTINTADYMNLDKINEEGVFVEIAEETIENKKFRFRNLPIIKNIYSIFKKKSH